MPDLADRQRRENDLAASIFAALVALRKSIDAGSADWGSFKTAVQEALFGSLSDTFAVASEQLVKLHGEGKEVDASNGANGYAAAVAAKVAFDATANTQAAVANSSEADPSYWFSRNRADMIAITETTGAISHGEDWAAAAIALVLLRTSTWFWEIEDNSACTICKPLNGEEQPDVDQPAHPGCRCRKRFDFSKPLFGAAA